MAADISSSAPRTSPYTGEWEYDVFLCFRGDTRHGFTSHLLSALSDKQIRTFIDHKLAKTESIDELISILQRCALSVVVFSEKFADSEWCLEEVVTIAERMKKVGHRVLPVFYKVDPFDVTDEPRSYMATIDREYKARSSFLEDKKRWMDAVNAVANCAGHTSQAIKVKDLIDKSLLTCVPSENGEMIEVHDLLKEMAWNIVKEEPKLGKRSRLVDPDDVHKLLSTSEVKNWSTSIVNLFKGIVMVIPRRKRRKVTDMHERGYDPLEEHRTTEDGCSGMDILQNLYRQSFIPNTLFISLYVEVQFEDVGKDMINPNL